MMDDFSQAPLPPPPPPTLAASEMVFPHDGAESKQLADQASHLTLATSSSRADASSATGLHDGVPGSSRSRTRTCSACSSAASDDQSLRPPPPARQRELPSKSIERSASLPATIDDVGLPSDAQRAPPISHEHAREETRIRAAAELDRQHHHMQPADVLPPPWPARRVGPAAPLAALADLPNEVLLHILGYLDVCDLLLLSRVSARMS